LRHELHTLEAAHLAALQGERLRNLIREREIADLTPYRGFALTPRGGSDEA
jgi:hypothetical protein